MTIKKHKSQVPDKSHNSYKINKKNIFGPKMDFLRKKNRPVIKDKEVRG